MKRIIQSLLFFAAAACGITDSNSVTVRLEGTVTAQATGQPVGGASIRLIDIAQAIIGSDGSVVALISADAQGRYSLTHSVGDCGDYLFGLGVTGSASGFASASQEIECSGSLQTVNFVLPPPPTP